MPEMCGFLLVDVIGARTPEMRRGFSLELSKVEGIPHTHQTIATRCMGSRTDHQVLLALRR